MQGSHRIVSKELSLSTNDREVMNEVCLHVLALQGLEVAASDDPRREGTGGVVEELVDEGRLSRQDDGEEVSRVVVHLGQGMELGEDIEPEDVSFVDDEHGNLLLGSEIGEDGADGGEHTGDGVGCGRVMMSLSVNTESSDI